MSLPSETEAVNHVLYAGKLFGYGNMIAHLKKAWAEDLIENHDFTPKLALIAADTSAYPLKKNKGA